MDDLVVYICWIEILTELDRRIPTPDKDDLETKEDAVCLTWDIQYTVSPQDQIKFTRLLVNLWETTWNSQ